MRAIDLFEAFRNIVDELSTNSLSVSDEEIRRILNFVDQVSTLPRGCTNINDESVKDMNLATFMLPLIRPRQLSWDINDWSSPNLIDQGIIEDDACLDSQEFNHICTRIAKRLKFNLTVAPIAGRTDPIVLTDGISLTSYDNYVPASYNYEHLPLTVCDCVSSVVGEEFYVKEFDPERFVRAIFANAMM